MTDELDKNEPLDPDTGPLRMGRAIALVAAGGAIGTTARYMLSITIPDLGDIPTGVFIINMAGAFLLGWLLEALALRGPDTGRRRELRLFAGTGIIGGFTTYSALAADTAVLVHSGAILPALLYSVGTVALGAAATTAGILFGQRLPRANAGRA